MSSNETLIPIPGRLHSVAVEGNVVGANEVVDDTNYNVPKKQSEINADTTLEIENIKAKYSNIESLIPSQATSSNQLADKNFVNSSISTATADFKGTYNTLSELQAVTANANDYGFVVALDVEGNTVYKKYKYIENSGWTFEYDLNNSSFTAAQWATIQSGMTLALTNKLLSLPNNTELQEALATINNTLNNKQDVINDLSTIRNKATTAYQKPVGGIPSTDLASGVIPSFTVVEDHSGAGDDPDKVYIPSAESHKQLYEGLIEDEEVLIKELHKREDNFQRHITNEEIHVNSGILQDIENSVANNRVLSKLVFAGHDCVDLGLLSGNLWATMNVGATRIEEKGYHFMWGDSTLKINPSDFTPSNCMYFDGTNYADKYKAISKVNGTDYFIQQCNMEDDVVNKQWKGCWQIPTLDDFIELANSFVSINTINGIECFIYAKNFINLCIPVSNVFDNGNIINGDRTNSCYLVRDIEGVDRFSVVSLSGRNVTRINDSIYKGFCVRPVLKLK